MKTLESTLAEFKAGRITLTSVCEIIRAELDARPDLLAQLRQDIVKTADFMQLGTDERLQLLAPFEALAKDDQTVFALPSRENTAPKTTASLSDSNATVLDNGLTRLPDTAANEVLEEDKTTAPGESTRNMANNARDPLVEGSGEKSGTTYGENNLRPGDVLNEQFKLDEVIGEGGMGVIFRAKDTLQEEFSNRDVYVALKVLSERFSDHPDSVMALHRETRNAMSLSHDNIVRVHSFARDRVSGQYFMVMEYLRGEPLNKALQRQGGKALPVSEVWRICEGICQGLDHAHAKGIVHSDIKPGNIWLTDDNGIKILDFGIARVTDPDPHTMWTGLPALSAPYASQELLRNEEPDKRDDVFAAACVIYELLTGHHPYHKIDALQAEQKGLVVARPKGLKNRQWHALRQALSLQRDKRTDSVQALLEGMAPSSVKPVVVAAALGGIGTIGITASLLLNLEALGFATPREDEADVFLSRLMAIQPSSELPQNLLAGDLEMGQFTVDEAREHFNREEYLLGNQKLKNGVTTAYRAYHSVIDGSDVPEQRLVAAQGILSIEQMYVETVDVLQEAGMDRKALWLACQGLAQPDGTNMPPWPPLVGRFDELWQEVKGTSPGSYTDKCNPQDIPESWGALE